MFSQNDIITNRTVKKRRWPYQQSTLISLVKEYPAIYNPFSTERLIEGSEFNEDEIWEEIGLRMKYPSIKCKHYWTEIKFTFAKLMILINTGKVTKNDVMTHPETARYFDGRLHFLDPVYVADITDNDIPQTIHRLIDFFFDSRTKHQMVYKLKSYSHAQVRALLSKREFAQKDSSETMDIVSMQSLVDTAVKRKLQELNFIENSLSIPSNEDNVITVASNEGNVIMDASNEGNVIMDASNEGNVIMDASHIFPNTSISKDNLGLETELIIEDDIKKENEADATAYRPDMNMNTNILQTSEFVISNNDTLNNDTTVRLEHAAQNISLTENATIPSDEYIKNFFKEMGEVMSLELSLCQQQTLKNQINNLLKKILVESESIEIHPTQKSSILESLLNFSS